VPCHEGVLRLHSARALYSTTLPWGVTSYRPGPENIWERGDPGGAGPHGGGRTSPCPRLRVGVPPYESPKSLHPPVATPSPRGKSHLCPCPVLGKMIITPSRGVVE
jgi:hypothetical protein